MTHFVRGNGDRCQRLARDLIPREANSFGLWIVVIPEICTLDPDFVQTMLIEQLPRQLTAGAQAGILLSVIPPEHMLDPKLWPQDQSQSRNQNENWMHDAYPTSPQPVCNIQQRRREVLRSKSVSAGVPHALVFTRQ